MIWNDVRIVSERVLADTALASLLSDLAIHQSSHLSIRAQLPISARMIRIVNALHTKLFNSSCFLRRLPAATGKRAMNWTEFITAEFHCVLLV
jgi:hypothetical protein